MVSVFRLVPSLNIPAPFPLLVYNVQLTRLPVLQVACLGLNTSSSSSDGYYYLPPQKRRARRRQLFLTLGVPHWVIGPKSVPGIITEIWVSSVTYRIFASSRRHQDANASLPAEGFTGMKTSSHCL